MVTKISIVLASLVLFSFSSLAWSEAVSLGSGYTCDGKAIIKGGKTQKLAAANVKIDLVIKNASNKLTAIKNSKKEKDKIKAAALKQVIADNKALKKLFKACTGGNLEVVDQLGSLEQFGNPTVGVNPAILSSLGTYVGTMSNNPALPGGEVFDGPIQIDLTLSGSVLKAVFTFSSGRMKTVTGGRLLAFSADVNNVGCPCIVTQPGTTAGTTSTQLGSNGTFILKAAAVPENQFGVVMIQVGAKFGATSFTERLDLYGAAGKDLGQLDFTVTKQ